MESVEVANARVALARRRFKPLPIESLHSTAPVPEQPALLEHGRDGAHCRTIGDHGREELVTQLKGALMDAVVNLQQPTCASLLGRMQRVARRRGDVFRHFCL